MPKQVDYYEFLQISPNADHETIHRVYHFLAARYHPDNPTSGDVEKFTFLKDAYDILSDPERRAQYDLAREKEPSQIVPLSASIDFMDQMEGELNRRLALLAVLYYRRRTSPRTPEVPLAEIETRMGFPRDYLDFTTWYLERKGYITKADNSDFTLTAPGVDFVESQRAQIPVLNKLLTATAGPTSNGIPGEDLSARDDKEHILPTSPIQEDRTGKKDRRVNRTDRRHGAPDLRANPVERRVNKQDRRRSAPDTKASPENLENATQPRPVQ
jgi:curved DNA-binding protein CbpA